MFSIDELRVVLVDDYAEVRFLLGMQLEEHDGVSVVGEAGSLDEALRLVRELRPDIVVLDQRLGRRDALSIVGDLRRLGAAVVVVSGQTTPEMIERAVAAGAHSVVEKHETARSLPPALYAAFAA